MVACIAQGVMSGGSEGQAVPTRGVSPGALKGAQALAPNPGDSRPCDAS